MYKPMQVCERLHMDLHMGTWRSAHVSAAAVARGDVHTRTHLHTHRRAYACRVATCTICSMHSTLTACLRAHQHTVHVCSPSVCSCVHWGN